MTGTGPEFQTIFLEFCLQLVLHTFHLACRHTLQGFILYKHKYSLKFYNTQYSDEVHVLPLPPKGVRSGTFAGVTAMQISRPFVSMAMPFGATRS